MHIPVGNRGDPACRSWPRLPAPPAPPRPHPLLMESIIRRLASSFEPSTPSLCSICNICSCCRHHQGRCLLPATLGHYCRFERKLWHARRLHSPIDYTTSPPTPHPHPIGRLLSFSDYVCVCVCVALCWTDGKRRILGLSPRHRRLIYGSAGDSRPFSILFGSIIKLVKWFLFIDSIMSQRRPLPAD